MSSSNDCESSDKIESSTSVGSNANNSFYASFKIYINKFSGGSSGSLSSTSGQVRTSPKKSPETTSKFYKPSSHSPTKIVRIERIECDENDCEEVFFDSDNSKVPRNPGEGQYPQQNADQVQIKVDPPSVSSRGATPDTDRQGY